MFKKELEKNMASIFGMKKTTFSMESSMQEQDTLFIDIQATRERVTGEKATAIVTGTVFINSQDERLRYGFFAKMLARAPKEVTRKLFFYNMIENNVSGKIQNLVERRASFLFLYEEQYDPKQKMDGFNMECC